MGDMKNAEIFIKYAKNIVDIKQVYPFKINTDLNEEKIDCVVLLPGQCKFEDIVIIARWLVETNKPHIVLRFTGNEYVVGPFVFPNKGACIECHIMQHLELVNRGSDNKIKLNNLYTLDYSKAWKEHIKLDQLEQGFAYILQDIQQLDKQNARFELFQHEKVLKGKLNNPVERKYTATTECACCRGMNTGFQYIKHIEELVIPDIRNPFNNNPFKYLCGGIRSKSPEETKQMSIIFSRSLFLSMMLI